MFKKHNKCFGSKVYGLQAIIKDDINRRNVLAAAEATNVELVENYIEHKQLWQYYITKPKKCHDFIVCLGDLCKKANISLCVDVVRIRNKDVFIIHD